MSLTVSEPLLKPTLLTKMHDVTQFDCGVTSLNTFLKNYALQNISNNSARTYVTVRGNRVLGYYSLAYGSISNEDALDTSLSRGLPRHHIPVILLARLAVDKSEKGLGLGRSLLKNALLRSLDASKIAGLRAMVVHAKDEFAKAFYEKYEFEPLEINPLHLFLLIKDIERSLQADTERK